MNGISALVKKFRQAKGVSLAERFLASGLFPVALAAFILLFYYLSLDMVMIWFVALCTLAVLAFCRDVTPIFAVFLFMHVVVSYANSPSVLGNQSDYFLTPAIYIQVIVAISLCVLALALRIAYSIYRGQFVFSPMFAGICALAAAFLLNGLFTAQYTAMNMVYGLFLAAIYVLIFLLVSCNVSARAENFKKIAVYFCVFSLVLATEYIVARCTYADIIVDGIVDRGKLFFGWGMYNTMGMLFCVCIPSWFYLAITSRHGFVFTAFGMCNIIIVFFTLSRQSMLGSLFVGIPCIVWLLLSRRDSDRLKNIVVIVIAVVAVSVALSIYREDVAKYWDMLMGNIQNEGGNRTPLWQRALEDFASSPLFGVGFYSLKDLAAEFVGLDIIPKMYHCTLLQLLGACGLAGIAAYAVHRVQTVISFTKKIDLQRIYVALTAGVLIFVSLFDNHMFYLFPTILYVGLVGLLKATEPSSKG